MSEINAVQTPQPRTDGQSFDNPHFTKRGLLLGGFKIGLISPLSWFTGFQFALTKDALAQSGTAQTITGSSSRAELTPFELLYKEITNSQPIAQGGIVLETPRLADNGHSAALRVYVQSPMTKDDYVKSIYLLSDRNPRPFMGRFDLSPLNPSAEISTRVRLNGSQNVYALALTSKGQWFSVHVPVEVTESACLDAS